MLKPRIDALAAKHKNLKVRGRREERGGQGGGGVLRVRMGADGGVERVAPLWVLRQEQR